MDEESRSGNVGTGSGLGTPFFSRTRSLSDGDGSQLSPSPFILDASRRTSKDDSAVRRGRIEDPAPPVTPRHPGFPMHGLSLHVPQPEADAPAHPSYMKPAPLSPKLDHSQTYASPTNILPRRSRGLDFSRAATSLHHSMLAEQPSPDSSPTIGGHAMNIPRRSIGEYGAEQSSTSLRSIMGNHERMHISSSVGSINPVASDSSSSGEDEFMDDEMEDAILTTPQVAKTDAQSHNIQPVPWMSGGSPTINRLSSFRTRPRKQPKKKPRGFAALGFNATLSRSPPSNNMMKEMRDTPVGHPRRESISWAANQLHISGSESDDKPMEIGDHSPITPSREGVRGVVKRVVTRRGNLLPKTKGFARIRAALAEESAPIDSELRREAEVIRQVRESDMDMELRMPPGPPTLLSGASGIPTAQSSPKLGTTQEPFDDIPDDDLMSDSTLSSSFKHQAIRNSKGNIFWDTFSETGSINGTRITPPPPILLPRGSSSGIVEDVNMDSPSMSISSGNAGLFGPGPGFLHGSDSQKSETPQPTASATPSQAGSVPPTAAEITRRINQKRRREDDFDPNIFKRRAVSPGMSVHNSPIMQSPLQRDNMPWGSRPGSTHGGDKASGTPSENGSSGGNNNSAANTGRPIGGAKGRVGFQGMSDTNDGLMRMSIE